MLAYEEYSSSRVAGAFFAAFGAGAVVGSVVAVRVVGRFDPLRLGAVSFVALTLPVFALAVELPVPGVMVALAASSFFGPLVNAPLIGVITMRTPEALRAKVMTAVLTIAMLAGPVGLVVAGPLLEAWGPAPGVPARRLGPAPGDDPVRAGRLPGGRSGRRARVRLAARFVAKSVSSSLQPPAAAADPRPGVGMRVARPRKTWLRRT